ncbi:MAG: hypothetical protein ABFC80_00610 [Coriobacteriales bacterium]|nr:helix-turn-helix domain-containing protein [Actinomycetes bacterium]
MHAELVDATESYVAETMHAPVALRPWAQAHELPRYLVNAYLILQGDLDNRSALWLFARDETTPAAVEKHLSTIGEVWSGEQVVVFKRLPSYVRQRLIERGISFVVPGSQVYLPTHGFDFRSRARRISQVPEVLRPSAQAMLLYFLLHMGDRERVWSATGLAPILGQSLMTASRAIAELEAHALVRTKKVGRTKEVVLAQETRETWEAAQDLLRTPVMRQFMLVESGALPTQGYLLAGLSALGHRTMLAEPCSRTYAVDRATAKELEKAGAVQDWSEMADAPGFSRIEVWSYDPAPLSDGTIVDPLSLSLSLRDDPDERIQGALRDLLETLPW